MARKTKKPFRHYEEDLVKRLKDPEYAYEYLKAAIDEKDEPRIFMNALSHIAKAKGRLRTQALGRTEEKSRLKLTNCKLPPPDTKSKSAGTISPKMFTSSFPILLPMVTITSLILSRIRQTISIRFERFSTGSRTSIQGASWSCRKARRRTSCVRRLGGSSSYEKNGFGYTPRLHIELFANRRGT